MDEPYIQQLTDSDIFPNLYTNLQFFFITIENMFLFYFIIFMDEGIFFLVRRMGEILFIYFWVNKDEGFECKIICNVTVF